MDDSPESNAPSPPNDKPRREPLKKPFRVLAFPGGGMDTAMQLGVIHAFLVARRRAPDMAAGISAGAIHAAALAEVLQTTSTKGDDEADVLRVARFREFLEGFRNAPATVFKGFLPDPLETITARAFRSWSRRCW